MRHDPIEIESSHRRRGQVAQRAVVDRDESTEDRSAVGHQRPEQVVDAAFAALGSQLARIDKVFGAPPENAGTETVAEVETDEASQRSRQNQAIVADVVTQLEALERQRERLARLLADVDQ